MSQNSTRPKSSSKRIKEAAAPSSSAPQPSALSKETIDSSDDEAVDSMDVDEEQERDHQDGGRDDSIDSEDDIEGVEPRRRTTEAVADTNAEAGSSRPSGQRRVHVPQHGYKPVKFHASYVGSDFDFNKMKRNPKLQLWAIRAPKDLKPSRLSSLNVRVVGGAEGNLKGSLKTKHGSYTLTSLDEPSAGPSSISEPQTSGEMGRGMRLMVPSGKRDGEVILAPMPISRNLILLPSDTTSPSSQSNTTQQESADIVSGPGAAMEGFLPRKRKQPSHLFKFRNMAYGFNTAGPGPESAEAMDEDEDVEAEHVAPSQPSVAATTGSPKKSKKQKTGEGSEGKKKKRAKA